MGNTKVHDLTSSFLFFLFFLFLTFLTHARADAMTSLVRVAVNQLKMGQDPPLPLPSKFR